VGVTAREAKRWSNVVFAGLFALAVVLLARILLPFLMPVLLGGFLVVLFLPVQEVLGRVLSGHRSLCAALSTLIVFVLILLPLAGVGWLVGGEVLGLLEQGQAVLERVDPRQVVLEHLPRGVGRHLRV
jgi:predicted PurR-regulated permease PerM